MEQPYISTGSSLATYNPASVDDDTATTTATTGANAAGTSGAHASAAAASAPSSSGPHHRGFKREKGMDNAAPTLPPQVPQETLCSLPPLGLHSDLISHLDGNMPEEVNNLGDLANVQSLGDEWTGGAVDDDDDLGGAAGAPPAPGWHRPWSPVDFNMDRGGDSLYSATMLGRDEGSAGVGLVPYSSESVSGMQQQQQQQQQQEQPPTVSWRGYAPAGEAGGGWSDTATWWSP